MAHGRVKIIGMGAVSAIGAGLDATLESLRAGRSGIGDMRHCVSHLGVPVGEVDLTDMEMARELGMEAGAHGRTTLLATMAAREAIENAGLDTASLGKTALISATTTGGMRETPLFYAPFADDNGRGRLRHAWRHPTSNHTDEMAEALGIGGWRTTISTACSSGANAIMTGAMMIETGMAETVIAGGADSLCAFTLGGFNSLKILSGDACHPLSEGRDGLNLGEGAAYIVMTADDSRKATGWLSGWSNANDAHHQTAMSDEGRGCQKAMREAMKRAKVTPAEIGYINLHGTATPNNDATEMAAIESVWGGEMPLFGSTKGLTGHTLAAAGALEAVFCLLGLREGVAWASAGLTTPMAGHTSALRENKATESEYALSNSLGFGGNCTALILRKA